MPNNNVMHVAENIIDICNQRDISISNLKLQKLLYFVQGECYRRTGEPMFISLMQAWQHGPVSPEVYKEYCFYGASSIPTPEEVHLLGDGDRIILEDVVKDLGSKPVWDLVEMTHKQSPWEFTYKVLGSRQYIANDMIKDVFTR